MSAPILLATGVASLAIGVALSDGLRAAASNVPILAGILSGLSGSPFPSRLSTLTADQLPAQALLMLPSQYAALDFVLPPDQANATTIFVPPGLTLQEMLDKPFHVYHEDFLHIIGKNPTLTLIADSGTDPVFHEANVWYPPTDEIFFVQSSGNPKTGTGLHKSAIIQKVSVPQAAAVASKRNAVGEVDVIKVDSQPQVINPNGATNFEGNLIFTGEGMGDKIAPTLFVMNPVPPYNTSVLLNNYYGRQFNSLNDVSVNVVTKQIYFTDVTYGERQAFRPKPRLPNQVYTINPVTKAVSVVADGFDSCNGITISPDGKYAYVTDTGANQAFYGYNDHWRPATIYRFAIANDGTFEDRKVFAHITMGVPDGVHCDSEGNVYSGCDDGVHVWNPSGLLIGKIFTGDVSPNFQFAGDGRMVICAETHLYYAGLAAKAAPIA